MMKSNDVSVLAEGIDNLDLDHEKQIDSTSKSASSNVSVSASPEYIKYVK